MRIIHSRDTCRALGVCESMDPDRFEINDEGVLEVLDDEAPESERTRLENIVRACPTRSLSLTD
ncbi:ferredoxin [Intrasporangium chromatireducens Q5-1]|uniref:Ferredoxin n=1 Tax=Intrasporangium chromatireducens Q5-1 TaxID=584657 RepID=W9GMQ0_9MICO|nr:ferredoxin [Intrasporangium chromatireducens Q5-1]